MDEFDSVLLLPMNTLPESYVGYFMHEYCYYHNVYETLRIGRPIKESMIHMLRFQDIMLVHGDFDFKCYKFSSELWRK